MQTLGVKEYTPRITAEGALCRGRVANAAGIFSFLNGCGDCTPREGGVAHSRMKRLGELGETMITYLGSRDEKVLASTRAPWGTAQRIGEAAPLEASSTRERLTIRFIEQKETL